MSGPLTKTAGFYWVGDHAVADFLNTIDDRRGGDQSGERLVDFSDLLRWIGHAQLLSADELTKMRAAAEAAPFDAAASLQRLKAFRDDLHDAVRRLNAEQDIPHAVRSKIETAVNAGYSARLARWSGPQFQWVWSEAAPLDAPLAILQVATGELLLDGSFTQLKVCEAHGCEWVFLDRSPKGRRRWCHMGTCGNREKVRQHRARRRENAPGNLSGK